MKVSKEKVLPLVEGVILSAQESPERFLRFTIKNTNREWNATDFKKVCAGAKAIGKEEIVEEESLKVVINDGDNVGLILKVEGLTNIATYCYSDSPDIIKHSFVNSIIHKHELITGFSTDITCTVVEERKLNLENTPKRWEDLLKSHIIEKQFIYEINKQFKYILKIRRSDENPVQSMRESSVSVQSIEYEFIVEAYDVKDATEILGQVFRLIQLTEYEPVLLETSQKVVVINNYMKLLKSYVQVNVRGSVPNSPVFYAPKPITLEQQHLLSPEGYGVSSILTGYAVTDKADGERVLLYVDDKSDVFLIDSSLNVKTTEIKSKLKNSLIDGEYIIANNLFAAFDIYFYNGEQVITLPLISKDRSRNKFLQEATKDTNWVSSPDAYSPVVISHKEHIAAEGNEMYKACRDILSSQKGYTIDGLIFTPTDLSVFGYYQNRPVKTFSSAKWGRVLKWKPPEQNSIDFLVNHVDDTVYSYTDPETKTVINYRQFSLLTGFNTLQQENISVIKGVELLHGNTHLNEEYIPKQFDPIPAFEKNIGVAWVVVDALDRPLTQEREVIETDQIVEWSYTNNPKLPVGLRWKPMRLRYDKTNIYKTTKSIGGTANDYKTAMNVWRSIHTPVTRGMIQGDETVSIPDEYIEEKGVGTEDVYYNRVVPREHSLSLAMLNFHNQGIKKSLYDRISGSKTLLDLCCGKAGDAPQWRNAGLQFVLGVDVSKDNIVNGVDGAYSRVIRQSKQFGNQPFPSVAFVIADCGKNIRNGDGVTDPESKELIKSVFGPRKKGFLANISGKLQNGGFDAVNCQFAIHYFFKSESTLNGFMKNVSDNLNTRGKFITTFVDGDELNKKLVASGNGVIEGREEGKPLWAVVKKYDSYNKDTSYGCTVNVFLEMINKPIPEYLVSFDLLCRVAEQYGLKCVESQLFKGEYDNYIRKNSRNLKLTPVQQEFSFMNRWAVFQK